MGRGEGKGEGGEGRGEGEWGGERGGEGERGRLEDPFSPETQLLTDLICEPVAEERAVEMEDRRRRTGDRGSQRPLVCEGAQRGKEGGQRERKGEGEWGALGGGEPCSWHYMACSASEGPAPRAAGAPP